MPKPSPRTTYKYSDEFKATAVRLSELPDVEVQDVASSLYIHPFMLSRWRKQVREGVIMSKGAEVDKETKAELKELRRIKQAYERLQEVVFKVLCHFINIYRYILWSDSCRTHLTLIKR